MGAEVGYMVLCDQCNRGYHMWCLEPQLEEVLENNWKRPWHSSTCLVHGHPIKVKILMFWFILQFAARARGDARVWHGAIRVAIRVAICVTPAASLCRYVQVSMLPP